MYTDNPLVLAGYPIFVLFAVAIYRYVDKKRYQDKHQDYRVLAEGLRVQHFWVAAGLNYCASDFYLRRHRDDLDWIRQAIRAASVKFCNHFENKLECY
jgi:hypothetical protein